MIEDFARQHFARPGTVFAALLSEVLRQLQQVMEFDFAVAVAYRYRNFVIEKVAVA